MIWLGYQKSHWNLPCNTSWLFYCRSSDEGEGIDPNAAFVKKNKKKKADSASVSQSKSDITNPALSGASSKKQADSTDVSMALILLPLQKLFTILHRQLRDVYAIYATCVV